MAINVAVAQWFDNWSEDATNITVPLATFPEMTAAEADAASGNISKVMLAMLEKLYQEYIALAAADKPTKMAVSRATSTNDSTGVITRQYTVTLTCEAAVGGIEVSAE